MSGIGVLFWFFFLVAMLQPVLRQKMLESCRMRLLRKLEKQRQSRVILLIHRQETMSLLGFPVVRFIDIEDSEAVIRALRLTTPDTPIDLVLHTPGGLVLAALQIAQAIKAHRGKVTVIVPHYAMSGGTLIALAADEILMDDHAALGPVDPQVNQYPASSILRAVNSKDINRVDDETLILADVAEKALRQIRQEIIELLEDRMPADQAAALAEKLSQGTWTHDHPITRKDAEELGLPVRGEIPVEFYQLMALFRQPTRRQASVRYVPEPYGPPASSQKEND